MSRTPLTVLVAIGLSITLAGCTTQPPTPADATAEAPSASIPAAPTTAEPVLPTGTPKPILTGLTTPWSIVFLGETALISERDTGDILEMTDGGATRVVGTVEGVQARGESGLLGLAIDDQDHLYAYSTASSGNRIQRFVLTGEPGSLRLGSPETLLDGLPSASFHDGGRIAFGPDGMLYATVGDAGNRPSAQDLDNLGGKILRMTPDGDVPDDNPFPGSLVYSYGHRNPQGIAWTEDGTMFASEFGQDTWDELNIITAGSNYGWPNVEGIAGDSDYVDPVQQWSPDQASPSGIAITAGTIFIANLRGEVLRAVPVNSPDQAVELYTGEYGRIRDIAIAPDGALWLATSNTDGRGQPTPEDDRLLQSRLSPSTTESD